MNSLSKKARELAASTGKLPHEILLNIARGIPIEVQEVQPDGTFKPKYEPVTPDQVLDAAKAGAPYYAPKISTVEVVGNLDDATLDSLLERAAAEAGLSLAPGGEGKARAPSAGDEAQGAAAGPRTRRRVLLD
jgi:hypothetical protein